MTIRYLLAVLPAWILLTAPAAAQVIPPIEETVVVTATLSPEQESEVGAATTVIDRKRIEDSGATTVLDLLRLVPGADVVRSGEDGALTSLFLRGTNSTQTLVLVDGVRVNSPFFSGYDFSALTTENVERIEIVRGPFSSLYGSDAMGGVVQIFTRPAPGATTAQGSLEAGQSGERQGAVFLSSGEGSLAVTGSYRHAQVDGDRANSDWTENNGSLRLDARLGDRVRAALEGSVLDGEAGVPGPVGGETPLARGTFREERVSLPVSFEPAKGHDAAFVLAHVRSTPTFRDPSDPFFGSSDTDARTLQARATDVWKTGRHRLTAFASWERWTVTARGSSQPEPFLDGDRTAIWGGGLQDSFGFGSRWFATLGLRLDHHGDFGGAASPRASLSWLSGESKWKVRASAGSAFRAPSVGELHFPFGGNPALEPERSRSYEVGLERYVKGGRAEASLFWNDLRDLIVFDFTSLLNENVGRARTRGVELAWRQQIAAPLAMDVGYTYLAAEDLGTGERLLRRPRHRAFAAASFLPLPRLRATLSTTFVGRRRDVDALPPFPRVTNPSYTRLDLYARYDLRGLSPYLRVLNLTDRSYEEADGFPAPGRRFVAGIEMQLQGKTARTGG